MADELQPLIREFLERHTTLVLATCDRGRPWATAVFFASDAQLNLYFVSDRNTRHGRNLATNDLVAGAVNADCTTWSEIQGVQLEGQVAVLKGLARLKALQRYLAKFPDVSALFERPRDKNEETVATRLREANVYKLSPDCIRLIDNRRGFGHKEEIILQNSLDPSRK